MRAISSSHNAHNPFIARDVHASQSGSRPSIRGRSVFAHAKGHAHTASSHPNADTN